MKKSLKLLFAGFGGQGILFAAKVVAYSGMIDNKQISWYPSYGSEMRGGTANCSVCISEQSIGSPVVQEPDIFVAMNMASLDKYIGQVTTGGIVLIDSSIVSRKNVRKDVTMIPVPATELAEKHHIKGLANIILVGKLYREFKFCTYESLKEAFVYCVPQHKRELLQSNLTAIEIGSAV